MVVDDDLIRKNLFEFQLTKVVADDILLGNKGEGLQFVREYPYF